MEARLFSMNMVRLHVLADSDEARDQRVKMCVVRRVRGLCARITQRARSAGEAYARLSRRLGRIERAAAREARRQGFTGPVRAQMGIFPFPDRIYQGNVVPSGDYPALRVSIGSGRGHNWWCVLYPQLCVVDMECAKALSAGGTVRFYSSIARFFQALWKGMGL